MGEYFFFGSVDDDGGGCQGHTDQSPERSFVLLAMASNEIENRKAKPRAEIEIEENRRQGSARRERE